MSDKQVLCPLVEKLRLSVDAYDEQAEKSASESDKAYYTGASSARSEDVDLLEAWLQKVEKLVRVGQSMRDCNYINTKNSIAWDEALKELRTP